MKAIINLLETKLTTLKLQRQVNEQLLAHHGFDLVDEVPEEQIRQLEEAIRLLKEVFRTTEVEGTSSKDIQPRGSMNLSDNMP